MSFQAMTWAVEQDLPALQKLVLLMLANRTNTDTGRCDPSHEKIASDCGMSRESVKRAIAELAAKGLIEIQRQSKDGVNLPNQYLLRVGASLGGVGSDRTQGSAPTEPTVGSDRAEGGFSQTPGVGSDRATKQEVKPVSKPKSIKTPIPENFFVSENVTAWAAKNGFGRLDERLEHFVGYAKANGAKYADWDQAFMNAIRDDWAKIGNSAPKKQPAFVW